QVGESLQHDDLLVGQRVEIGRRVDQATIHQLLDDLVAKPLDVHGAPGHEVDNRLLELRPAAQAADAAVHRPLADRFAALAALDQLGALHRRATHRALLGYVHRPGIGRAAFGHHTENLRDHIPGAAHDHGVADHHTQARHLVHVVQGGFGNGHPRHLHGFQARHRGNGAGTSHLEFHIQQLGDLFPGRELVGDRPARFTGAEAQLALLGNGVDLEHHAVDLVGQVVPARANVGVVVAAFVHAVGQLQLAADGQAPALERVQDVDVAT